MRFRGSGFWLRLALAVSLALNLAVVGMVAGAILHRRDAVRTVPLDPGRGLFGLIAMLPPERREDLRDSLGGPPPRSEIAAQWTALREALLQPEATAADLQAQLAQIRLDQGMRAEALEAALAGELSGMSFEERKAYVARLERLRPGGRHHDGPGRMGRGHEGPGPDGNRPPHGGPRPGGPDADR